MISIITNKILHKILHTNGKGESILFIYYNILYSLNLQIIKINILLCKEKRKDILPLCVCM